MKIRLEKPAVNISNLTGGKNEKARRGALHEKPIELKYGDDLECWMRICAVQNIEAMFWRRAYFLYGKKSAVVRAVTQK